MSKSNVIRYDLIVQNAMLSVVRHVLKETQENGLPSDHHFYLTYSTTAEGVEMPSHLLEKYPDEITIVLQHEFEDLKVNEDFFDVTLWFNNVPAHLKVPFKAIRAFFDPSVKFGLQFNSVEAEEEVSDGNSAEVTKIPVKSSSKDKSKADQEADANEDNKTNIISLDSFRKK